MKTLFVLALLCCVQAGAAGKPVPLFDGKTFAGWEGDTNTTFRIENGAIVAGSFDKTVPRNEFLCTRAQYTNFILRLQFKLQGTNGFVNGGVQVRSQRVPKHFEVSGYQADMGEGWWGALYDESRRNKVLIKPDPAVIEKALKRNEWNDYEVRCQGKNIQVFLNGSRTIDYTEDDDKIPQFGILGLQVHGGGKTVVAYRQITIEVLP